MIQFKVLTSKAEIEHLLQFIPEMTANQRYKDMQFRKYLNPTDVDFDRGDTLWYGCFEDGICKALSILKKYGDDCILMAEIQTIVKGYGKLLIENILSRTANIWWCADPESGEERLNYYRQFPVKEAVIQQSKWTNSIEHVFYKADVIHEPMILDIFRKS